MPSELTEKLTRLRAAGDDDSQQEAARLEREAEKAPRKRAAKSGNDNGNGKTSRKRARK